MLSVFTILKSGLKNEAKITPTFLPNYYPSGIFLRNTHVIIYGQEVWASSDRGASFQKLLSLKGDAVVDVLSCNYNSLLVLLTARGKVFIMRAGLERYSILNVVLTGATFLQCDHMGTLMAVKLDGTSPGGLSHRILPIDTLIQEDVQPFPTTLALQYISPVSVLLHEFPLTLATDLVSNLGTYHIGKIFSLRHGGEIAITDVFQTHFVPGFVYCARGDVLQPVNSLSIYEEPLQKFHLLNQKSDEKGTLAILTPQTTRGMPPPGFEPRHVGMTVVSPGLSSFIIVEASLGQALTRVTMPDPLFNRNLNAGRWLLFDTRPGNWSLHEGPCLHTLESVENLRHNALVRINVRETLSFTFKALKTDHSFSLTRFKKRMKVALTNPTAMRVTARHYWDKTNNHILTLTVYSHVCKKATTLVTVFIPEASLVCSRSSFTFTLENACPEGLSIVYLPSQPISDHEWIYGDPEDENDNKRLFDLPVNYRPPSQLGVLIPTTDNIYNADPSKPRPRQHYPVSKNTGRYKQCAGKASAAECGCTDALKVSPLAINSDCRQRVLRMIYPLLNFNITLFLRRANQADQPLRSPYFVTVTEVNNRTNWAVTGTHHTTTMTMMRRYLKDGFNRTFYNPKGLQISCYGSELFHFRISVIPGVVLCDLVEEVQIYVDKAPLAFPAAYVISCMTAIALGGFLVLGFLLKNISPPTPRNLRALLTRGRAKVAPETEDENQD
ncbi:hypothetical protein ACEWY4_022389 [Coilia grayii]|uniref:Cation channel sperm-associated protein subunit beta n=1 Tax=Coilia grayii TaxID=363190 RepID=A0ABD1J5W6_9TELE